MQYLIWAGAAITLAGLGGLVWCILKVAAAKRETLSDEEMRQRLARLVPVNLGSLFVSAIGLMMVIIGIALG